MAKLVYGETRDMKNWFLVLALVLIMAVPFAGGCSMASNDNWQDNIVQVQDNIHMFTKLATRIALNEADVSVNDLAVIKGYLIASRDLLSEPGNPNFDGARNLARYMLPEKYHIYGFSVIDIIERYLSQVNIQITQDQESVILLISAAIDGALEAVDEFS